MSFTDEDEDEEGRTSGRQASQLLQVRQKNHANCIDFRSSGHGVEKNKDAILMLESPRIETNVGPNASWLPAFHTIRKSSDSVKSF